MARLNPYGQSAVNMKRGVTQNESVPASMKTIPLALMITALTVTGCGGPNVVRTTSDEDRELPVFHTTGKPASAEAGGNNDLMYGLLVGEVALQRGQLDSALQVYSKAARESKDPDVIERAARIADVALNAELGVEMARLWVARSPKDLEAHQFLANGLMRSGKSDAAVQEFEFILATFNDNKQSYFRVASQLAREKNQDAALEVMGKLAHKHADDPYAQLAYAQLAARYNRMPLALDTVDVALKMKNDWPDALVLRAHILQMQNKTDEALSIYNTALSGPLADNSNMRMAYARLLLDIKRFDEAYIQYGKLAERESNNGDILYATALLALQTNHYDHAEKLLLQLLKLHERTFEASYYLGQIAEKNNFGEEAMDWYDQVSSGEFYFNARLRTSALMAKQGSVDEALSKLHVVKASSPQETMQLYLMEGDIYLEAGNHQKAYDIYEKALKEMPDSTNLLYAHAIAAEKLNRVDIAERDLRDVLKLDPNNVQALNALGYTLADRTDRYSEALSYIQRAMTLDPKDAAIIDSMGWVQFRLGNHNEAIAYLRQALELTQDSEVAAHLGEVLLAAGKKDEAVNVLKGALKTWPDNKSIIAVMRRFGL